jgi:hypothetical protein
MTTESRHTGAFSGLTTGIPAPRLDAYPEEIRPFVKIGLKVQSEFLRLYGCRARAWLDWPQQCASCKSVSDLTAAQRGFFACMQHDYAQFADAVLQDTLIEQDELDEDEDAGAATPLHRDAA